MISTTKSHTQHTAFPMMNLPDSYNILILNHCLTDYSNCVIDVNFGRNYILRSIPNR